MISLDRSRRTNSQLTKLTTAMARKQMAKVRLLTNPAFIARILMVP